MNQPRTVSHRDQILKTSQKAQSHKNSQENKAVLDNLAHLEPLDSKESQINQPRAVSHKDQVLNQAHLEPQETKECLIFRPIQEDLDMALKGQATLIDQGPDHHTTTHQNMSRKITNTLTTTITTSKVGGAKTRETGSGGSLTCTKSTATR